MNTIKRIVLYTALTASVLYAVTVFAKDAKVIQDEVFARGQAPISRSKVLVNGLPYGLDFFGLWKNQAKNNIYKLRAQTIPLNHGPFGAGVAAQHVDGTKFEVAHEEAGLVGRIQGKPSKGSFVKTHLRYFPSQDLIDTDGIFVLGPFGADLLGSYNLKTGVLTLESGIEYKIGNFAIGVEGKLSRNTPGPAKNYAGLRAKCSF